MDERYTRSVPPEFERRDGRRVPAADDNHIEVIERVGLVVVVFHLGEVFTGYAKVVGQIVVAGGDGEFTRPMLQGATEAVGGMDGEVAVTAADGIYGFVLTNLELIMLGYLSIVFEGFDAAGLLVGTGERDIADLKQLRRGEEGHVGRIVEERVAEAALVDQHGGKAGALRFNSAGKPGGGLRR